jgi:hypothetical protein
MRFMKIWNLEGPLAFIDMYAKDPGIRQGLKDSITEHYGIVAFLIGY